jgi:hypothetical protein
MRFKGLNKDGNWVSGYGFVPRGDGTSIIVLSINDLDQGWRIVSDETVCVGSGIEDELGNEIFKGDIIRIDFGNNPSYYVVKYDSRCGQFYLLNSNVRFDVIKDLHPDVKFFYVGNIHTDKDLLNRALKRVQRK